MHHYNLCWGPLDHLKQEAKKADFKGASMSRQKFGSGRAVETSLSSSPSLKGKRDVMAKHSEAMDFGDWCKNECVKLLGSKGGPPVCRICLH
ncbi:unnamed protein product [Lactuca virosa]|uniref:Uncharacterized protein n=1 Tax=Lactuca virosa TaxID=75947 RepID=A0AAU9MF32_9ASTR|nr:unnamed protein product [Lactuca virosa]